MHTKLIALLTLSLSSAAIHGAAAPAAVAVTGDPEQMLPEIERALAKDDFVPAMDLMSAYFIRVRIDRACCSDASTEAAMDQLTIRAMHNPKYGALGSKVSREELRASYVRVGEQIGKALADNTLSSPEWIAKYGMNKFLRALAPAGTPVRSDKELFGDPASWPAKRQAALDKFRAEFSSVADSRK